MSLRMTLEIVPFGDESMKRTISTMTISRKQVSANPCDYTVRVAEPKHEFTVLQHQYEDGAWELVRRALEILCGYGGP